MFKILLSKLVLITLLMLRMPSFALEAWPYFIEQARQLSLDKCCLEYVDQGRSHIVAWGGAVAPAKFYFFPIRL